MSEVLFFICGLFYEQMQDMGKAANLSVPVVQD